MRVSVVIPVRDEELTIGDLLDSLAGQTRAPDEVVVADGGSRDRTPEIVEEYARKDGRIRLIRTRGAYPGEGRNLGVRAASHDMISFTDAGIRLDRSWIEKLCEPMEKDPSVDVVYGSYEPAADTFFKECAALAYVPAPVERGSGRIRGPSIASSLMKRSVWEAVGGFPPYRAAEDLIFMESVEKGGFRIAYAPGAVAYWQLPDGWRSTFRRFATYSHENLVAGRGRYWHAGVARMYGVALAFAVLGALHASWWWLVPLGGFVARVLTTAAGKRQAFAFTDVFRPARLLVLAGLILLLDAATLFGAATWMLARLDRDRRSSS